MKKFEIGDIVVYKSNLLSNYTVVLEILELYYDRYTFTGKVLEVSGYSFVVGEIIGDLYVANFEIKPDEFTLALNNLEKKLWL